MTRIPLSMRAVLLVPLLAAAIDQVRATIACGSQSCLETAGGGALGAFGVVVLVAYALGVAALVGRLALGRSGPGSRWLLAAGGLAAVCGGSALLAAWLGDGALLGGGWLELLAMCGAVGAVLALALRVARAVVAFRPSAPRLRPGPLVVRTALAPLARRFASPLATAAAGRAPPLTFA